MEEKEKKIEINKKEEKIILPNGVEFTEKDQENFKKMFEKFSPKITPEQEIKSLKECIEKMRIDYECKISTLEHLLGIMFKKLVESEERGNSYVKMHLEKNGLFGFNGFGSPAKDIKEKE